MPDSLRFWRPRYTDVVGLDLGNSAVKAVRLRRIKGQLTLVAAELLPALSLAVDKTNLTPPALAPYKLPKALCGRYVALAIPGVAATVKLLTMPVHTDKATELPIREMMAVGDDTGYRIAYELLPVIHGHAETRALAVALPSVEVQYLPALFPVGLPAICSIEIAGLAALTAYQQGPGLTTDHEAVAMLDFGANSCLLAVFAHGGLVLIRRFDVGSTAITQRVRETLGVDLETAEGVLMDGSFDVSKPVAESLENFTRQALISRDFIERRENCRIGCVYVCGGIAASRDWRAELHRALGVEIAIWNPLACLPVLPGAIPDTLAGHESRFAAAMGAAMGVMGTP
ncbi:MAG: pilus assembly protein PilM [bacterium]